MITSEQIESLRQSLHTYIDCCIDAMLENSVPPNAEQQSIEGELVLTVHELVKEDTFLEEINQPVKLASNEPEPVPNIPELEDLPVNEPEKIAIIEDLKERLDLVLESENKDLAYIERDSKEFLALAEFSMLKNWQKSNVDNFLIQKRLKLSERNESHLDELRKFGEMVKANEMTVNVLLSQSCLSEAEINYLSGKYNQE